MKAVVLEEQGVINVREVPDVKDPGPGAVSYTHLTLPTKA